ncbi:MAG: ankyrin repeat domain-containing protein [Promethearchaeia archaeon]
MLEADANDSSPSGWSAAQYAAFNGHADVLRALLKSGGAAATSCAPPGTSSMPPLMCAAVKGQIDCMSVLLDAVPAAMFLVKTPAETKAVMAGRVPSQVPATYGKRLTCVSPKR